MNLSEIFNGVGKLNGNAARSRLKNTSMHRSIVRGGINMSFKTTAALALQGALLGSLLISSSHAADLIEVWQAAKGHDPEYLAAQSDQSAGEARRSIGDTLLKPSVNFTASAGVVNQSSAISGAQFSTPGFGTHNNANFDTSVSVGTQTRYALQASQPLYDRERSAQKNQLQLSADVTDMGMAAADQALILRVAESYFEALKSQATINLLVEQQDAVSRTYAEISKRQNLGDASKIDLQLTGGQVEAIKSKLLNANLAHKNNLLALSELTGQDVKVNALDDNLNSETVSAGKVSEWLSKAKLQNKQLKILALQSELKRAEIEKYKSGYSPKVDLIAKIEREAVNGSGDYGSASNTASNNMIGIQLNVPLTDGYRSAKKEEAYHLAEKSQREYEHASLAIEREINSLYFALEAGGARIDSLAKIVSLSKDRLNATERIHRQGSRTTLELLGAQSDYIASKLVLMEEQVKLIVNRIKLSSIAGDISEQDLKLANRFIAKK